LHRLLLRAVSIDQVFARAAQHDLARDADRCIVLEADRRFWLVAIVEDECHRGFGDARLATLVDEVTGAAAGAQEFEASDSQTEADGVEDVGFSGSVQAGDRIEGRVPACDDGSHGVRLEAVDDQLGYPHGGSLWSASSVCRRMLRRLVLAPVVSVLRR
jgi:hypothetical protein